MKVKFADKIYEVLYTMKVLGKSIYAVEDEPNHIDWLVNVEVINEEEKSKDKEIKTKFKVGDWVVLTVGAISSIHQIINIDINKERYWFDEGTYLSFADEKYLRFWIIKDAEDGDILWHSDSASNGIFIFKKIKNDGKVLCYCDYDSEDHFCLGEHHTCCWTSSKYVKPATKEQRDLLFQKIHETGYEWDADKKELKKIEQKPVEETSCDRCKKAQPSHSCQDITELGRCYLEHEKQGEQKLIWDKFDDLMLKDAIEFIESGWSDNGKSHLIYWLKSIKDRIK